MWARATVFGACNGYPVITTGWADLKIGPLLRGEKFKRYYFGYFRSERPLQIFRLFYAYAVCTPIWEPKLQRLETSFTQKLYVFGQLPRYPDYFKDIREHRDLIRNALWDICSKGVLGDALQASPPTVGIHVRRSDFREQAAGEEWESQPNVRTPNEYFIRNIELVRNIYGGKISITIYTDAHPDELRDFLTLGNVQISASGNALHDLILLSRARCLILSHGSTFGYWAAFLANAPVIVPFPLRSPIRSPAFNGLYYEGVGQEHPLLIQNIRDIS